MSKLNDPNGHRLSRIEARLRIVAARLREEFGVPLLKKKLPDPLELLIATILSQNTNDVNSHKAFINLKSRYPDFSALSNARPRDVERLIKVGGIANKKSKTIINVVREVKKRFRSFDRRSLGAARRDELIDKLTELNGVGYKTASCVSLFALGDPDAFPVDTHVHRVTNRIGIVKAKTPDKTFLAIRDHIPPGMGYELHINLIRFGRKICTSQRPKCYGCIMFDICRWENKSLFAQEEVHDVDEKKVSFMLLEEV